ncbi:sporulation inhibitor of replication protein SirA [Bacillus massilinigeriensis]|uniref:sporulation inhibitor of replication protein SirA n=1 Tax=Bacillus mediterraneensis TaxID=1805474 RepID=UPI0008F8EF59|nr:sporulation inhibitor of replication protein SirA [Bacillus mediterraneensis]
MRSYQLYLIEEEFAAHYFGRERMFFTLFKEHFHAEGERRLILEKQIDYITKPIPVLMVHQQIHQNLEKTKGFTVKKGIYHYEKEKPSSSAEMVVRDKSIRIDSKGNEFAETVFFEELRKVETSFLAIDTETQKFGWLKPIKERKFV